MVWYVLRRRSLTRRQSYQRNVQSNQSERLPLNSEHLHITTTILRSHFELLQYKGTSEKRPHDNYGHYFGDPRVVVVHRFDCVLKRPNNTILDIRKNNLVMSLFGSSSQFNGRIAGSPNIVKKRRFRDERKKIIVFFTKKGFRRRFLFLRREETH